MHSRHAAAKRLDTAYVPRSPKNQEFSKTESGRRIRDLRETRGLTQVELARLLDLPQSNVSEMERGARGLTVHQAVRLSRALRVTTDEILGRNGAHGASMTRATPSLKLLRRLQKIEKLPEARQRVVLKLLDALIHQEQTR
jgi:transcriptional regulator with XRE-family HTH domain